MTTREIALRCAAKVQEAFPHLLAGHKTGKKAEASIRGADVNHSRLALLHQLDGCKDDSARRLILGRGEQYNGDVEC